MNALHKLVLSNTDNIISIPSLYDDDDAAHQSCMQHFDDMGCPSVYDDDDASYASCMRCFDKG